MTEAPSSSDPEFDKIVADAVQADFSLELDALADEYLALDPEKRTGFLLRKVGEIATTVYGEDYVRRISLTRTLIDQFGSRMVLRAEHPAMYPGEIEAWRFDDYPNGRFKNEKNDD